MHAFRRCRGMHMAVFDMAGTVIDEGGAVYKTLYETMRAFGLSVGPRDVDRWHGASKYEVLDHFLANESTVGEFAQRQRDLHRLFEDNLKQIYFSRNSVKLIDPSVPQLFEGMRLNGTKVALNTGYSSDIQLAIINNLRLGGAIDDRIASDEVPRGRPHPHMIEQLMINNGIEDPRRVMKVGDTPNDILEGIRAKCAKQYGVLSGAGTHDSLKRAGATEVLNSVLDLK